MDAARERHEQQRWHDRVIRERQSQPQEASMPDDSFTCPICNRTSWNPNDVEERWCNACHGATGHDSPPGMRWVLFIPRSGWIDRFGRLLQEHLLEDGATYTIIAGDGRGDYRYADRKFVAA